MYYYILFFFLILRCLSVVNMLNLDLRILPCWKVLALHLRRVGGKKEFKMVGFYLPSFL